MRSAGIGETPGSTAVFDSATLQAEATALGTSAVGRLLAEDVERLQATNPAGENPDQHQHHAMTSSLAATRRSVTRRPFDRSTFDQHSAQHMT